MLLGFGIFNVVEKIVDHYYSEFITLMKRFRKVSGFIGMSDFFFGEQLCLSGVGLC